MKKTLIDLPEFESWSIPSLKRIIRLMEREIDKKSGKQVVYKLKPGAKKKKK